MSVMEIQHYSHQHKLTFFDNEEQTDGDDSISCHLCEKPITGASYNCRECNFSLHESCAKLTGKIWHRFHRQHRLTLRLGSHTCFICGCYYSEKSLMYVCDDCSFRVDVKCASLSSKCEQKAKSDNPHQFVLLKRAENIRCDACGIDCDLADWLSQPNICTVCHLVVHFNCRFTTQRISLRQHRHPLVHVCIIHESEGVKSQCRICRDEVSTIYACYYCPDPECNFIVHVRCGLQNMIGDQGEDQALILPKHTYSDMILSFRSLKQYQPPWSKKIEPEEEEEDHKVPREINHFSHHHNLTLCDDEIDAHNNKKYYCDGCILPISNPFYRCTECDFLLHEICLRLPTCINSVDRNHAEIYDLKPKWGNNDIFSCSACHNHCHGFTYHCNGISGSEICIPCVSVPHKFTHSGHEHDLSLVRYTSFPCNACGTLEKSFAFGCPECLFALCYKCATLPATIQHSSFGDQYVLTYHSIDKAHGEYYCDLCEKARDPKHWFYYCVEIDYCVHPVCALGKHPYLKPGHEYHLHPLSSVLQRSSELKMCDTCSEFCGFILPPKTVESSHEHTVHLVHQSSYKQFNRKFSCHACQDQIIGELLFYYCLDCGFSGHLKCVLGDAFIENTLHHEGRKLTFVQMTRNYLPCISCGQDCEDLSLACPNPKCSFIIHYDCRTKILWTL